MTDLITIAKKISKSEIIDKNGYKYIILPFDFVAIPEDIRIFSEELEKLINNTLDTSDYDKIITIESKGILISTIMALKIEKPLYIIRKRSYNIEGERKIQKTTGYERSEMFVNGIFENDRILIIDDLISTGGTLGATIKILEDIKCKIKGVFAVFDKPEFGGSELLKKKYSFPLKTLIKLKINEDNSVDVTL